MMFSHKGTKTQRERHQLQFLRGFVTLCENKELPV